MTDEIVFITKNFDDQNNIQLSISVNGTKYHKTVRFSFKNNFATEIFLNKYIIVSDVNESSDKIYFKPSNKDEGYKLTSGGKSLNCYFSVNLHAFATKIEEYGWIGDYKDFSTDGEMFYITKGDKD